MLELKKGVDILTEVGGIKSIDEARKLFEEKLDAENLAKLKKIKTEDALLKIANAIALVQAGRGVRHHRLRGGHGRRSAR